MYSCGKSGGQRKKNLEQIISQGTVEDDSVICGTTGAASVKNFGNFTEILQSPGMV